MKDNPDYTIFIRSCTNWREFANAKKEIQEIGLTRSEAYEACENFNKNRTEEQIENGTKMEFTRTDNFDFRELAEFEENN